MFYDKQAKSLQEEYKSTLRMIGLLSGLFTTNETPYLYYRCHENIFAKVFCGNNFARNDDAIDVVVGKIGFGLKTFLGTNSQKIAEFDNISNLLDSKTPEEQAIIIANEFNNRLSTSIALYNLDETIYHFIKRVPNKFLIYETPLDFIDVKNITVKKNKKSFQMKDGLHTYSFHYGKHTLFRSFSDAKKLDEIMITPLADPFGFLSSLDTLQDQNIISFKTYQHTNRHPQLCLRLYSIDKKTKEKYVPEHSGLNAWNGSRLKHEDGKNDRNPNEIYIPYPRVDRDRCKFFPPKGESFSLNLPNGETLSCKVCQDDGKAIASNPNKALGKWLLRDVLHLKEGTLITYELLDRLQKDCLLFTKISDSNYEVDLCKPHTYESMYPPLEDEEEDE